MNARKVWNKPNAWYTVSSRGESTPTMVHQEFNIAISTPIPSGGPGAIDVIANTDPNNFWTLLELALALQEPVIEICDRFHSYRAP